MKRSLFIALWGLLGTAAAAQSTDFSVGPGSLEEDRLVFRYTTPFPGLTKVLLSDAAGELLWRGQYINGEGAQEVRFRADRLQPGTAYTFRFEYKLDAQEVSFTLPL